jgi:hypothetical protein
MKSSKLPYVMIALALAVGLRPDMVWATKPVFSVAGTVTATPVSGEIEVDHRVYRIKRSTAADKNAHSISEGEQVDLILDAPPNSKEASVVGIALHSK